MKTYFSISILVIYMISCTELNQLLRIPLLIEHFIEHNQGSEQLSISEFVHMHYLEEQHMDGDYEKDMQLPFKTINGNTLQMMASIPRNFADDMVKPIFSMAVKYNPYPSFFIDDAYLSSIWQPPKTV